MILELLLGVVLLGLIYSVYLQRRPRKFPPGPFIWPIVGNFLHVGIEAHKGVMSMRKKYGDIIGLDLGFKKAVFLNDYKLIREAFNSSVFSGRYKFQHMADQDTGMFRGILFNSGKAWVEQRRFAFSFLQSEFRNGTPVESFILREVEELKEVLMPLCGKPLRTYNLFSLALLNSVWSTLTGERYALLDPTYQDIMKHITYFSESTATQGLFVFCFPIAKMMPKISGLEEFRSHVNALKSFIHDLISEHKRTYEEGIQRDFIDYYLHKINGTTDPNSQFFGKAGELQLHQSMFDLLLGTQETSSSILMWTIFLMAHHPEMQEKLNSLIIQQIGKTRLPSLSDRGKLPYVDAVINEVLRYSSFFPLGVFHEAMDDVEFHGYQIPKGALVAANQYAVHHDPEIWGDPENFNPDRFLSEDRSEVVRHPALIAFSTGRRVCPGEAMARDQLFLFIVTLFQQFQIEFDPDMPKPPMKYTIGTLLYPVTHQVVFHNRSV